MDDGAPLDDRLRQVCDAMRAVPGCERPAVLVLEGDRCRIIRPDDGGADDIDWRAVLRDEATLAHLRAGETTTGPPPSTSTDAAFVVAPALVDGHLAGAVVVAPATSQEPTDRQRDTFVATVAELVGHALLVERLRADRANILSRELLTEQRNRRRIADRLHDGPQQILVSLGIRLQLLEEQVGDELGAELRLLADQAEAARNELRGMILDLDTLTGHDALTNALRTLLDTNAAVAGWRTSFRAMPGSDEVDEEAGLTVERVVQEALANARLHAGASQVDVRVDHGDGWLEVVVVDDGGGVATGTPVRSGHGGLRAMHERATLVGGRVEVERSDDGGTAVRIAMPMHQGSRASTSSSNDDASSGGRQK